VAEQYKDLVVSTATVNTPTTVGYLMLLLLVGLMAGLFVPWLPLGMPRRGFELYTWMAAFQAGELVINEHAGEEETLRHMELEEIEKAMGGSKVMYAM